MHPLFNVMFSSGSLRISTVSTFPITESGPRTVISNCRNPSNHISNEITFEIAKQTQGYKDMARILQGRAPSGGVLLIDFEGDISANFCIISSSFSTFTFRCSLFFHYHRKFNTNFLKRGATYPSCCLSQVLGEGNGEMYDVFEHVEDAAVNVPITTSFIELFY